MRIVVCQKYAPGRVHVDAVTGQVDADPRAFGPPLSDQAALELALLIDDSDVTVACVGPVEADVMLREALAVGATRVVRFETLDSPMDVAAALATVCGDADLVLCGDGGWAGSGSVPALIAARLGRPQMLGAVQVEVTADGVRVHRRLDRGRIGLYESPLPAVVSVEGSVAKLRRASLPGLMAANDAAIDVRVAPASAPAVAISHPRPARQRTKVVAPPAGDGPMERILAITKATEESSPPRTLRLDPAAAAAEAVSALRQWGYI